MRWPAWRVRDGCHARLGDARNSDMAPGQGGRRAGSSSPRGAGLYPEFGRRRSGSPTISKARVQVGAFAMTAEQMIRDQVSQRNAAIRKAVIEDGQTFQSVAIGISNNATSQ